MSDEPKDEIGRLLRADELKAGTIVVVDPPDLRMFVTMHVTEVRDNLVVFYSGILRTHVINLVRPNGEIIDDRGRVVRVFEYLGEP